MNRKFVTAALLFFSASVLVMSGCGPEAMNGDFGGNESVLNNDASKGPTNAQASDSEPNQPQADDAQEQPQADAPAAAAAGGGCPVGKSGCATGNCESPQDPDTHRTVQLPDRTIVEPTKVTPTGEKQIARDVIDTHQTTHIWQPSERHHTTHKHRITENRFFPKKIFHPTNRRINRIIRTGEVTNQVMPTVEEVAPLVDHGCADPAPEPVARAVVVPVVRPVIGYGYGYPFLRRPWFGHHRW